MVFRWKSSHSIYNQSYKTVWHAWCWFRSISLSFSHSFYAKRTSTRRKHPQQADHICNYFRAIWAAYLIYLSFFPVNVNVYSIASKQNSLDMGTFSLSFLLPFINIVHLLAVIVHFKCCVNEMHKAFFLQQQQIDLECYDSLALCVKKLSQSQRCYSKSVVFHLFSSLSSIR